MGKIKGSGQNSSLRKSLILYVAAFALLAVMLSVTTASVCNYAADRIWASYPPTGEKYYLTNQQGETLGEGAYIGKAPVMLSARDERRIAILEVCPVIATPLYSAACVLAAALLFYKNKLKEPLAKLQEASSKIARNDLNFSLTYEKKDELGALVASFERMRATLADNFARMWRQVEERKALNAAFAHELRTPLTVLKGYHEMLQASELAQTRETAATMARHLSRMEAYVSSMGRLGRLEDSQPEYKAVSLGPFLSTLQESARILCAQNQKRFYFQNEVHAQMTIFIDAAFITQVCDNLLANAIRYAKTSVTFLVTLQEEGLLLSVSDDGKGFSDRSLSQATNPFFTGENNPAEHFGLGLYICRLLCERHGGCLKIDNLSNGAKVSAFFKTLIP